MGNKLEMDCCFEYEGEIICSRIKDDRIEIRAINCVEKMKGYLDFYDKTGYCGTEAFYESFDDMSPVKPHIAKKYYIQLINRNK